MYIHTYIYICNITVYSLYIYRFNSIYAVSFNAVIYTIRLNGWFKIFISTPTVSSVAHRLVRTELWLYDDLIQCLHTGQNRIIAYRGLFVTVYK